jgi:hypothetical protein
VTGVAQRTSDAADKAYAVEARLNALVNRLGAAQPAADFTTYTVTAAAYTQCSKAWTIAAGDPKAGTIYRLTVEGLGTQGTPTQETLAFETSLGLGVAITNQTFAGAAAAFGWKVVTEWAVISTGAGGTANVALNSTAGAMPNGGFNAAVSFDTTVVQTLELMAKWGATAGAPTMTSYHSYLERLGP